MFGINAQEDTVIALKKELGLDKPKFERYLIWVKGMLIGDFGVSYTYRSPVIEMVGERLWVSCLSNLRSFIVNNYSSTCRYLCTANRGKILISQ